MTEYDPRAIQKMANLLNSIATIVMALAGISAALTIIGTFTAGSQAGQLGGLILLGGLLNAVITVGTGYLVALVLRVGGQLMLALVQIEYNTRAGAVAQVQTFTAPAVAAEAGVAPRILVQTRPQDVREVLEAGASDAERSARADAAGRSVAEQSERVRAYGDDYPGAELFELGRRWALLFDETGDPAHREKALSAMTRAREIDPECGGGFFSEGDWFGSLTRDPEFKNFS
jgi:hypothetical protein